MLQLRLRRKLVAGWTSNMRSWSHYHSFLLGRWLWGCFLKPEDRHELLGHSLGALVAATLVGGEWMRGRIKFSSRGGGRGGGRRKG